MKVCAIDTSLTATGFCTIAAPSLDAEPTVKCETFETKAAGMDVYARRKRLVSILSFVADRTLDADLIVIESPALSKHMGSMHDRSGVWWLIVDALIGAGLKVAEVSPTARAKYATGKGNAGKDAVMFALGARFPDALLRNNNEADAFVLCMMGARHLGMNVPVMPKMHSTALEGVQWPL